jgi:hypothetical protein
MLDKAIAGQPYNKAAMIREVQLSWTTHESGAWKDEPPLQQRSRGSIEAKLMNASAAHLEIAPNAETMATHGYKAWGNYQAALKDAMRAELDTRNMRADILESAGHSAANIAGINR